MDETKTTAKNNTRNPEVELEKLRRKYNKQKKEFAELSEELEEMEDTIENLKFFVEHLTDAINNAFPIISWIPCSKFKPENNEYVLVCDGQMKEYATAEYEDGKFHMPPCLSYMGHELPFEPLFWKRLDSPAEFLNYMENFFPEAVEKSDKRYMLSRKDIQKAKKKQKNTAAKVNEVIKENISNSLDKALELYAEQQSLIGKENTPEQLREAFSKFCIFLHGASYENLDNATRNKIDNTLRRIIRDEREKKGIWR